MKWVKSSRKWKPDLSGKTTGDSRLSFLYAIIGLLAVNLILFFPIWIGKMSFFANDIVNLNLPQRHLLGEIWRNGEVPLWNPFSFGGQPLLAAMQAGVLYPLNGLFLFLPDYMALNLSYILHYWLAGVFLLLYVYALKRDILSAWTAGVIFMSSGFLMGHLIHTQMLNAAIWLPLVLYFLEKLRQTGRTRYAFGMALTLTIQWLAGHPQISFYTYLIAGLYLLFFAWQEKSAWRRTILQGFMALLMGTLLASVQLIPTFELIGRSVRETSTLEFFASGSLTKDWLGTLFVPFYHGGGYTSLPFREDLLFWEYVGYVGVLAIAVALAGVMKGWKRPHVIFWTLITGLGLLLSVGTKTPLYSLLYHVPVMNLFRFPSRYLLFMDLGAAILVGLLLRELLARWTGRILILNGLVLVGAVLWWIRTWWQPVSPIAWQIPVFVLLLAIGGILLFWKHPQWLFLSFVGILAMDSIVHGTALGSYTWRPLEKAVTAPATLPFFAGHAGRYRIASFEFGLGLDRAARYGVEAVNGYDSLVAKNYAGRVDLGWSWGPLTKPRENLDLLNVKYVIVNQADTRLLNQALIQGPLPGDSDQMRPVWSDQTTVILENPSAYPRYWLSASAEDYRQQQPAKIRELSYGYSTAGVSYSSGTAGILMISQLFDPGWKAYIDGQRSKVLEIGGFLSGVSVPAGEHQVDLRYEPAAWLWGRIVSGVSLVLMAAWAVFARIKLFW